VLILLALATPAMADVIRLADGQVLNGTVRSCQGGEIVVDLPASQPIVVNIAEVTSGEGTGIEACLGGRVPQAQAVRGKWYGGQILIAEGSSVALLLLGAGVRSPGLGVTGLAGIALSPAILHSVHGNGGRAAASIGIHVGLGALGALLGTALIPCGGEDCFVATETGAALGLLASQVVATVIDVSSFAYEDVPSRFAVGPLLAPPQSDRRPARKSPAGVQLSLRF
jgi:hypothetical protein